MKGRIRNIFPGGNTPQGFYSYYNDILPQRKAEKIFCIKGGPGTGKSTLMKAVGNHFAERGEDVDFLWCSSDPDSLDGVLLKKRRIALLDGTAPHIVDPKNPGAVDEIVNLGEYWDTEGLRSHRDAVISCNERTSAMFELVYGYLGSAGKRSEFLADVLQSLLGAEAVFEVRRALQVKLGSILTVRRTESRRNRECAMGSGQVPGMCKKAFVGAITPDGIKSGISSLIQGLEKVILLRCPAGFPTQQILEPAMQRLLDAGFDLEAYYCPMDPEKKLEHIIVPDAGFAIVTCNRYHTVDPDQATCPGQKFMEVSRELLKGDNKETDQEGELGSELTLQAIRSDLEEGIHADLTKALELLKNTRRVHDELESYYIPSMNFAEIEKVQTKLIAEIEAVE